LAPHGVNVTATAIASAQHRIVFFMIRSFTRVKMVFRCFGIAALRDECAGFGSGRTGKTNSVPPAQDLLHSRGIPGINPPVGRKTAESVPGNRLYRPFSRNKIK
jgi:hypothetical protein